MREKQRTQRLLLKEQKDGVQELEILGQVVELPSMLVRTNA
jgi:hypothetical protein